MQNNPNQKTKLLPLPNLFARTFAVLALLYGFLTLILITVSYFVPLPFEYFLGIGVVVIIFQFLISPFMLDLSLRWFYQLKWVKTDALPAHLQEFLQRVCTEQNMKIPSMGIIDDGAPNAFTYGHVPNNARIVITQGLLELLQEEEVEAVVAHEIGHAKHWDMVVMSAAQLIPLVLHYVYRLVSGTRKGKSSSDSDGKGGGGGLPRLVLVIVAYVLYIVSEYIVLWLSRVREYYADRFAGRVTGSPQALVKALIKIGYGLSGEEPETDDEEKENQEKKKKSRSLASIGALGIFDSKSGAALAISSLPSASAAKKMGGEIDKENLQNAMKWDLWNPWARFYELNSTHPLIANRIVHLDNQARVMGLQPYINFQKKQPESYWDEFGLDFLIWLLPKISMIGVVVTVVFKLPDLWLAIAVLTWGATGLLQNTVKYRMGNFSLSTISELLGKVKVSGVRPVPCKIKGTVIGRGIPGLIWSEDFVIQDESGILFLDYHQPIPFWNLLFGLMKRQDYEGKEVEITGWYRRSPVPYVEMKTLAVGNKEPRTCYTFLAKYIWSGLLTAIGLVMVTFPNYDYVGMVLDFVKSIL